MTEGSEPVHNDSCLRSLYLKFDLYPDSIVGYAPLVNGGDSNSR